MCHKSVSYTHLDVYKRQAYVFLFVISKAQLLNSTVLCVGVFVALSITVFVVGSVTDKKGTTQVSMSVTGIGIQLRFHEP